MGEIGNLKKLLFASVFLVAAIPSLTWASNVTLVDISEGEPGSPTNPLRPSDTITIFVQSDTPLLALNTVLTVTSGLGTIISATGLSDCTDYGWDPLFSADPIINGLDAEIRVGNYDPPPPGVVGYFVMQSNEIGAITVDLTPGYSLGGSFDWMLVEPEISGQLIIYVTAEPPPLTLVSPNGGEVLVAGNIYTINWLSSVDMNEVLIEYSTDNAQNWNDINIVPNTGSYDWLVPAIVLSQRQVGQ